MSPQGIDIVTVCLDVEGRSGAAPDLAAVDDVTHIAVVDQTHALDELFGITNVPMAVWIDADLNIARPAEFAWPGEVEATAPMELPAEIPERMIQMAVAAGEITADREFFLEAVRDWAVSGAASTHVLSADQVIAASVPRGLDQSQAAAHFELAQHWNRLGHVDDAVLHFRQAHQLDPQNWTYKRQAWELASRIGGPLTRFWQGPVPGSEQDWPYEGDWLSDIRAAGPENYYPDPVRSD